MNAKEFKIHLQDIVRQKREELEKEQAEDLKKPPQSEKRSAPRRKAKA